jgi:molecular chaperone HtpG
VFRSLVALHESDPDKAKDYVRILYYQAELLAGLPVETPEDYAGLVFALMQ